MGKVANCPGSHAFEFFKIMLQLRGNQALSTLVDLLFFLEALFCTSEIWVPLNVEILAEPVEFGLGLRLGLGLG